MPIINNRMKEKEMCNAKKIHCAELNSAHIVATITTDIYLEGILILGILKRSASSEINTILLIIHHFY